jgi:hypothetical protein
MKTFAQFIKEAIETLASTEAKNRGLVSDGHGDYYDNQGNLVAKTIGGKLKYFGRGNKSPKDIEVSPQENKKSQTISPTSTQVVKDEEQQQEKIKGIVILLGRFNPPSKNHEALLKAGYNQATRRGFEYRIYPSRIQDGSLNPLNPSLKISYMKSMFSKYEDYIVDSDEIRTIFDALSSVYNDGFTDVIIVVGQDRLGEFQSLAHKGEGQNYQFNNIEVISSGVKDPDSDVESAGSSAMMRTAAAVGDYERFATGLPASMKISEKQEMFNTVMKSIKVTEDTELWKIAPELDVNGLRQNYKNNGLFEVGSLVENQNTGLQGRILRRGSNHLICVTKEGIMFKSWLKDVREVYEIGTCEYRAHAQEMTPGQPVTSYTDILIKPTMMKKNINISRKKVSKVK